MDTIQNTFFTNIDDLMYEINNIYYHLIKLEDKQHQTSSDIQQIQTLHSSHRTDSNDPIHDNESVPLNIKPNVLKADSTPSKLNPNVLQPDFKSTHPIKPPVVFDVGKWRKEIKHVVVKDEEFQTIECWYSDVSQCIG